MISAHSTMHSLQIATPGVDPATIFSASVPRLPQNEQQIDSSQAGPGGLAPASGIDPRYRAASNDLQNLPMDARTGDRVIPCTYVMRNMTRSATRPSNGRFCMSADPRSVTGRGRPAPGNSAPREDVSSHSPEPNSLKEI